MRRTRISILLACVGCLVLACETTAQERTHVRIETNYPDAIAYADSLRLGRVYGEAIEIPTSTGVVRLVPPEIDSWSVAPISRSVDITPGDTLVVRLDFPFHYRIESVPFGADVHIEAVDGELRRIGSTPTLYSSRRPISGMLLLQKPGFVVERIDPGSEIWNRYIVELSPSDDLDPTAAQVNWRPPKRHRAWIDYAALGAALAAGAVAIHYKFKADDLYAEYEETGDASLRSDIKRYDVRSGVALGVMQGGIGLFAIRLALR